MKKFVIYRDNRRTTVNRLRQTESFWKGFFGDENTLQINVFVEKT